MTLILLLALLIFGFFTVGSTTEAVPETTMAVAAAHPGAPSLTIANWVCPLEFTGASYAQDCDLPVPDMEFAITAPLSAIAFTDASGTVTFAHLPPGTYEVTGGPPGEFVQNAIACHVTGDESLAHPFLPRHNLAIGVTLTDTDITCDWYSIPEDHRGDG